MEIIRNGVFIIAISISLSAIAKDLGTYGEVWEIKEQSAIELITSKLKEMEASGAIEKHNRKFAKQIEKTVTKPLPIAGIRHTTESRKFKYDPSISYSKDLKDHRGQIFYKAGTKVNPLDHVTMPYEIIFLDGDHKGHMKWVLDRHSKAKIKPRLILVKGAPIKLSEKYEIAFYFDQFGAITKKLGIKQVPAIVVQEGDKLNIHEIKLKCKRQKGEDVCLEEEV